MYSLSWHFLPASVQPVLTYLGPTGIYFVQHSQIVFSFMLYLHEYSLLLQTLPAGVQPVLTISFPAGVCTYRSCLSLSALTTVTAKVQTVLNIYTLPS